MSTRARVFEYSVALDEAWAATSDRGGEALAPDEEHWTPEHLVLAGLARCSLTSFRYHARQAGIEPSASAGARGEVTRREEDDRFAFVGIEVEVRATLDPAPGDDAVRELVEKGERDCFVGASLTAPPRYRWIVNGTEVA